ncbi:TetR family regulatory protein [Burkholderia pseudomallei]|nr:TetR family regulatory protein [Burkholderia pseudomallei]
MARKTREESLNTKNRILDAAELVLLEKGVGQTAMADIAEAAGMSRGAVYGHLRTRRRAAAPAGTARTTARPRRARGVARRRPGAHS